MYRVIKRGPLTDPDDEGAFDYLVAWSADGHDPVATVRLHSSGSFTLIWHPRADTKRGTWTPPIERTGWMYPDEAAGVAEAMRLAVRDGRRRRRKPPSQEELDEMTDGFELDLNRRDTIKVLRTCRWRTCETKSGIEIEYQGRWRHLYRTDLKDDVRTWRCGTTFEQYRRSVAYGARVTDDGFFIIDSFSDG